VSAGGVTVMLSPHGDSADIIQQGLQIYAMIKEQKEKNKKKRKNHSNVDQKGHDNAVALSQKGNDNYGVIVQRGHDHTATVAQNGDNNAFGLFSVRAQDEPRCRAGRTGPGGLSSARRMVSKGRARFIFSTSTQIMMSAIGT
jgi:hypothetical protein